jgi:hypothetical protein
LSSLVLTDPTSEDNSGGGVISIFNMKIPKTC